MSLPAVKKMESPAAEAAERLARDDLAYLGLESFCAPLDRLFALRPLLGVRSAVNTLARALNPGRAPCQLQGVPTRPTAHCTRRVRCDGDVTSGHSGFKRFSESGGACGGAGNGGLTTIN